MLLKDNILSDQLDKYTEDVLDTISTNVKKYRKLKNYSQLALALEIGMNSSSFFGRAELRKKDHYFSVKHIIRISKVLDIPIGCFFQK